MKRAVSTVDASAASQCSTHRKLKRCKSAFANLKRLGAISGNCSSGGTDMAGEDSLTPRWRQHSSSPDVSFTGKKSVFASALGTGADSLLAHSLRPKTHGTNNSSRVSIFGGGMNQDSTYPVRNTFPTPLNFDPVPEADATEEDIRCFWHRGDSSPDQDRETRQQKRSNSGLDHQHNVDVEGGMTMAVDCGSGSPGFSIVGFGNFFDLGGEEEEEEDTVPMVTVNPGAANRLRGLAGTSESQHQPGTVLEGTTTIVLHASHAREPATTSGSTTANSTVMASTDAVTSVAVVGDHRGASSADDHSSSTVMIRLQRRFEEMLLVSNVAT